MNIYTILGYVIMGTVGGFMGYLGYGIANWELWAMLILAILYGIVESKKQEINDLFVSNEVKNE